MPTHTRHSKLSSVLFFGLATCLLIIGLTMTLTSGATPALIKFGSCTLQTEIVRTPEAQEKGLGGRTIIPNDYAMLFPFNNDQPTFWMKGMLVPIDIVWVSGKRVVQIDPNLPVDSGAKLYQAPVAIDWVIEVGAGRAAACEVAIGSTITGLRS